MSTSTQAAEALAESVRGRGEQVTVRARLREFVVPPVRDCVVIGREAPIGVEAMKRAVSLLHAATFDHLTSKDIERSEVIEDVLIRKPVLKKLSRERLLRFIVERVEPYMGPDEIIQIDLEVEISVEHRV